MPQSFNEQFLTETNVKQADVPLHCSYPYHRNSLKSGIRSASSCSSRRWSYAALIGASEVLGNSHLVWKFWEIATWRRNLSLFGQHAVKKGTLSREPCYLAAEGGARGEGEGGGEKYFFAVSRWACRQKGRQADAVTVARPWPWVVWPRDNHGSDHDYDRSRSIVRSRKRGDFRLLRFHNYPW